MRTIEVHYVAWCDIDLVLMVAGNSQPDVCHRADLMVTGDISSASKGAKESRLSEAASEAMCMPSGSVAFDMAVVHPPWARCWPRRHSTSGLARI